MSDLGLVTTERVGNAIHSHDIEGGFAVKIPTHRDYITWSVIQLIYYVLIAMFNSSYLNIDHAWEREVAV